MQNRKEIASHEINLFVCHFSILVDSAWFFSSFFKNTKSQTNGICSLYFSESFNSIVFNSFSIGISNFFFHLPFDGEILLHRMQFELTVNIRTSTIFLFRFARTHTSTHKHIDRIVAMSM